MIGCNSYRFTIISEGSEGLVACIAILLEEAFSKNLFVTRNWYWNSVHRPYIRLEFKMKNSSIRWKSRISKKCSHVELQQNVLVMMHTTQSSRRNGTKKKLMEHWSLWYVRLPTTDFGITKNINRIRLFKVYDFEALFLWTILHSIPLHLGLFCFPRLLKIEFFRVWAVKDAQNLDKFFFKFLKIVKGCEVERCWKVCHSVCELWRTLCCVTFTRPKIFYFFV